MKDRLEQRLQELKREFESGQKRLREMDERAVELKNTLLRISGAIQVLEEELRGVADTPHVMHNGASGEKSNL